MRKIKKLSAIIAMTAMLVSTLGFSASAATEMPKQLPLENVAFSRPVYVSTTADTADKSFILDGDSNTYWQPLAGDTNPNVVVDLTSAYKIYRVDVKTNGDDNFAISAANSLDATDWTVLCNENEYTAIGATGYLRGDVKNPTAYRYVKLEYKGTATDFQVNEIMVYSPNNSDLTEVIAGKVVYLDDQVQNVAAGKNVFGETLANGSTDNAITDGENSTFSYNSTVEGQAGKTGILAIDLGENYADYNITRIEIDTITGTGASAWMANYKIKFATWIANTYAANIDPAWVSSNQAELVGTITDAQVGQQGSGMLTYAINNEVGASGRYVLVGADFTGVLVAVSDVRVMALSGDIAGAAETSLLTDGDETTGEIKENDDAAKAAAFHIDIKGIEDIKRVEMVLGEQAEGTAEYQQDFIIASGKSWSTGHFDESVINAIRSGQDGYTMLAEAKYKSKGAAGSYSTIAFDVDVPSDAKYLIITHEIADKQALALNEIRVYTDETEAAPFTRTIANAAVKGMATSTLTEANTTVSAVRDGDETTKFVSSGAGDDCMIDLLNPVIVKKVVVKGLNEAAAAGFEVWGSIAAGDGNDDAVLLAYGNGNTTVEVDIPYTNLIQFITIKPNENGGAGQEIGEVEIYTERDQIYTLGNSNTDIYEVESGYFGGGVELSLGGYAKEFVVALTDYSAERNDDAGVCYEIYGMASAYSSASSNYRLLGKIGPNATAVNGTRIFEVSANSGGDTAYAGIAVCKRVNNENGGDTLLSFDKVAVYKKGMVEKTIRIQQVKAYQGAAPAGEADPGTPLKVTFRATNRDAVNEAKFTVVAVVVKKDTGIIEDIVYADYTVPADTREDLEIFFEDTFAIEQVDGQYTQQVKMFFWKDRNTAEACTEKAAVAENRIY